MVTQEDDGTFCTWGEKSRKNCYLLEDNCAVHNKDKEIKGCYQEESGKVKWSNGYTSELTYPCGKPVETCPVQMDSLVGKSGRSWNTRDIREKTFSTLSIKKEDG